MHEEVTFKFEFNPTHIFQDSDRKQPRSCRRCRKSRPSSEFYRGVWAKDPRQATYRTCCKSCRASSAGLQHRLPKYKSPSMHHVVFTWSRTDDPSNEIRTEIFNQLQFNSIYQDIPEGFDANLVQPEFDSTQNYQEYDYAEDHLENPYEHGGMYNEPVRNLEQELAQVETWKPAPAEVVLGRSKSEPLESVSLRATEVLRRSQSAPTESISHSVRESFNNLNLSGTINEHERLAQNTTTQSPLRQSPQPTDFVRSEGALECLHRENIPIDVQNWLLLKSMP